jgi:serine/threonine protein kinase
VAKKTQEKTNCIVEYLNHWYDDIEEYNYILMEYCPEGDLSNKISKRIKENKKFSEEVYFNINTYIFNIYINKLYTHIIKYNTM